jgi:hypothetical protein
MRELAECRHLAWRISRSAPAVWSSASASAVRAEKHPPCIASSVGWAGIVTHTTASAGNSQCGDSVASLAVQKSAPLFRPGSPCGLLNQNQAASRAFKPILGSAARPIAFSHFSRQGLRALVCDRRLFSISRDRIPGLPHNVVRSPRRTLSQLRVACVIVGLGIGQRSLQS